jgi:hypothetical protein
MHVQAKNIHADVEMYAQDLPKRVFILARILMPKVMFVVMQGDPRRVDSASLCRA